MAVWKHDQIARFAAEYCCRNDQNLTIESDTAGLTGLFGYTAEEIASGYRNSLLMMIDPDSRELCQKMLAEQLAEGEDVEVIFSVHHKNGDTVWVFNRGQKRTGEDGQEYLTGILVDVTRSKIRYDAEKQMTRALQEQAEQDSLTKIYNAQTARKLAEKYLADSEDGVNCALLIIDLDDFKQVNDSYGHMFGDAVLVQAAQTIKKLFRSKDIVGRIGGEEFMVLMKDITDSEIVNIRCNQLNTAFHDILCRQMTENPLSCSIGVSFAPAHGRSYFELFCCADQALYLAKDQGKDRYAFYDPEGFKIWKNKSGTQFTDYDEEVLRGYIDQ